MNRKIFVFVLLVALLALPPAALWAQEEGITLETVSEAVSTLIKRVDKHKGQIEILQIDGAVLTSRVSELERQVWKLEAAGNRKYTPRGADDERICQLANLLEVQPETLAGYRQEWPKAIGPVFFHIRSVWLLKDGTIAINQEAYRATSTTNSERVGGAYVVEYWQGCEFKGYV